MEVMVSVSSENIRIMYTMLWIMINKYNFKKHTTLVTNAQEKVKLQIEQCRFKCARLLSVMVLSFYIKQMAPTVRTK